MYTGSRLEDSSGAFHRACLPSTSHLSRWGGGHDKACQVSGRRGTTWCSCGLDGIWSKDGNSSWDSTNQNGEEKGDLSTNRNGDEWLLVWSFSGNMGDEDGWMKHDDMIIHEVKPTINGETNWQLNLAMAAMEYPPLLIDIWSYQLDHSFRSRLLNGGFNQNIWFWVGFIDITIENCQQKGIRFFKKTGGFHQPKCGISSRISSKGEHVFEQNGTVIVFLDVFRFSTTVSGDMAMSQNPGTFLTMK